MEQGDGHRDRGEAAADVSNSHVPTGRAFLVVERREREPL